MTRSIHPWQRARAPKPKCLNVDCLREARACGYCGKHYQRFRRTGSALDGRKHAIFGEPLTWLLALVTYQGDECVHWPFASDDHGYGRVWYRNKVWIASRLMCTLVHGEPHDQLAEAAHRCGNGHLGCMNPRHLMWKSHSDNMKDLVLHGRSNRGQKAFGAVNDEDVVREIIRLRGQVKQVDLATRFGLSQPTVSQIQTRQIWGWLEV